MIRVLVADGACMSGAVDVADAETQDGAKYVGLAATFSEFDKTKARTITMMVVIPPYVYIFFIFIV